MVKNAANKQGEKIKPVLQFAVLCDGITAPDQRGKVSFIGIFDKFIRPGIIPHFSLALGWKNGKGTFNHKVRLLNPDLKQLLESPDLPIELKHETQSARNVIDFNGMDFSKPGVYWVEILLEGETIMSIPLPVDKEVS